MNNLADGGVHPVIAAALETSESIFAPMANEVDYTHRMPASHLEALRESGVLGCLSYANPDVMQSVGEILASACLSTAFVWGQHQGATVRLFGGDERHRDKWVPRLIGGTALGGVCYAGLYSHGASLRARVEGKHIVLDGIAPFVTSWPWLDVLVAWAMDSESELVHCLALENPQTSVTEATEIPLIAATATATYRVKFENVKVSADCVVTTRRAEETRTVPLITKKYDSMLGLGVLRSTTRLLARSGEYPESLSLPDSIRARIDDAARINSPDHMAEARSQLLDSVMVSAERLFRVSGSAAAFMASTPSRLLREAAFIQVSATTPDERLRAGR